MQNLYRVLSVLFMVFTVNLNSQNAEFKQNINELLEATGVKTETISDQESLVLINNELGMQIYNLLNDSGGNVVFSPYSVSTALQMVYAGAAELTQSQMTRVLHFTLSIATLQSSAAAITDQLTPSTKRSSENPLLLISNSLWVQSGHPILPDFEKTITSNYKGKVKAVDFRNKLDQSRQEINSWVKTQTNGKITDLVSPTSITNATRMLLVTALYMNGKWLHTFDPNLTRAMPFFPYPSSTVTVPMMSLTASLPYVKKRNFAAIQLDYATKAASPKLSMIIVLPHDTYGLKEVESSMSAVKMKDLLQELKETSVTVSLPKFKVTSMTDVKSVLEKMGLSDPFSGHADFSGIDGTQDLRISAVIQKAYLSIDERGTEAGVATSAALGVRSMQTPEIFIADHPFMFYVIDRVTGAILFVGRIVRP